MTNKKLNLIFDGTLLINAGIKNSGRSGIYFTTYTLLKEFIKSDKFNIYFYCQPQYLMNFINTLNNILPEFKNIQVINKPKFNFTQKLDHYSKKYTNFKNEKKHLKKIITKIKRELFSVLNKLTKPLEFHILKSKLKDKDIFFSPKYAIPDFILKNNKIKKYTILYDTIPLKFPELVPKFSANWVNKLLQSLNKNDYYFAISENTKNDFIALSQNIEPQNIIVTPLASMPRFKPHPQADVIDALKKYNLPTDKRYVFCLCTLDPRKNQIRAVKSFTEFIKKHNLNDIIFILGGASWDIFITKLQETIGNLGEYKNKIIQAGYIDDEDLASLYSGAEWFVYTSQYEGFGLPPLEAMACSCPVITSNNSSLPEVVGDAGIMIDWDSDEQHIEAYEKYYFDNGFRNYMAQKGLERSKMFSWEKCADIMITTMLANSKK